MYVCICAAVTDTVVRSCIARGARTVEEVGEACEAGTGLPDAFLQLPLFAKKPPGEPPG